MKLILFDFDGVIVNSFEVAYDCMKAINGTPDLTREEYRKMFYGNIYGYEPGDIDEEVTVSKDHPFFKIYAPRLYQLEPVEGIQKVLETHKAQPMAVVSSTIHEPINTYLQDHKLNSYFNEIYGADVHKSKVVKIQMALERFDTNPSDTVFISDTLGDLREGTHAGVHTIGVTWGFHNKETLDRGDALAVVDSPQELLSLLN